MFFVVLAKSLTLPGLKNFTDVLPVNVSGARAILGRINDNFSKWVSCQKCSSLYVLDAAKSKLPNGTILCGYVRFPNHPQQQHRKPCGHSLMKASGPLQVLLPYILSHFFVIKVWWHLLKKCCKDQGFFRKLKSGVAMLS